MAAARRVEFGYNPPAGERGIEQVNPATFVQDLQRVADYASQHFDSFWVPDHIMRGDGERYLLRSVAEHADWWLAFSRGIDTLKRKLAVLEDHCRAVGRDPATIRKTYPLTVFLARTRAEAELRAGRRLEGNEPPFAGEPAALRERLLELADLGFDLFQLVFAGFPETDDMRLFVEEVLPAFRQS